MVLVFLEISNTSEVLSGLCLVIGPISKTKPAEDCDKSFVRAE